MLSPPQRLFRYLNDSNSRRLAFLSCLSSSAQIYISLALWICLIIWIWFVPRSVLEENLHPLVVAILPWAILFTAAWLFRSGERCLVYERRVTAAEEETDNNELSSRRTILYLRSFEDDEKAAQLISTRIAGPHGGEAIHLWYTEEEQLKAVIDEFGYLVAIRKPDDAFPHSGASRLQVGHEWQKKVSELMAKSLFVVIRLGTTDGLLWELQTAVRYLEPCRLLLLVPFDEMEYNNFCNQHQDVFPKSLPSYDQGQKLGSLRGVIWFQEDWTPEFLPLKRSELYLPMYSLQSALKVSLLPFFDRLKLPYQPLQPSFEGMFKWVAGGLTACVLISSPFWLGPPAPPCGGAFRRVLLL